MMLAVCEWAEGEHPTFWQSVVEKAVAERKGDVAQMLKSVTRGDGDAGGHHELSGLLKQLGLSILARLYPEAKRA